MRYYDKILPIGLAAFGLAVGNCDLLDKKGGDQGPCSDYRASIEKLTNCTTDSDGDGICDADEEKILKTSTDDKDVFIELDYMVDSSEVGMTLNEDGMNKIVDAFAAQGYIAHIDVGQVFNKKDNYNPDRFNYCGGNEVPLTKKIALSKGSGDGASCGSDCSSVEELKPTHFEAKRVKVFHYAVMGKTSTLDGVAGLAFTPGTNLYIAMGGYNSSGQKFADGQQAITLMHEWGHNLNLQHGGDESDNNYKPNYESIMNYAYSFGLNKLGQATSWFTSQITSGKCDISSLGAANKGQLDDSGYPLWYSETPDEFVIDFSSGENDKLNENSLNESTGYAGKKVDFNCDGSYDSGVSQELTDDGALTANVHDFNDWANLKPTSIVEDQSKVGDRFVDVCYRADKVAEFRARGERIPNKRFKAK